MTKDVFITGFIVDGKGGLKDAEIAWKVYREEHGAATGGFNGQLASALLKGDMTEDAYNNLIDEITPNPERPYARQHKWIYDLVQAVRAQYH